MLRRYAGLFAFFPWLILAGIPLPLAQAETTDPQFVPGEVIVQWKNATAADTRSAASFRSPNVIPPNLRQLAGRAIQNVHQIIHPSLSLVRLQEPTPQATLAMVEALKGREDVEYAEPNYIRQAYFVPSDENFRKQWYLEQIKVPKAWNYTKGDTNTVVAVIDTGILQLHPDLKTRLVTGFYFVSDPLSSGDGDGRDGDPTDQGNASSNTFHGTHVAGIIGAIHNRMGIAGINAHCKILPVRALGVNGKGNGKDSDIAAAIRWAAGEAVAGTLPNRYPAKVINLSFGNPGASTTLRRAVEAAQALGAIVVAAAGNDRQDASDIYPAAIKGVIMVAAAGPDKKLAASYSNFGPRVDLLAPGGTEGIGEAGTPTSILSTGFNEMSAKFDYVYTQGTSQATPVVSGVISLMLALNNRLKGEDVRNILSDTAFPDTTCPEGCGAGLINAEAALAALGNQSREAYTAEDFTVHGAMCQLSLTRPGANPRNLPLFFLGGIGLLLLFRRSYRRGRERPNQSKGQD
jgi:serine protease